LNSTGGKDDADRSLVIRTPRGHSAFIESLSSFSRLHRATALGRHLRRVPRHHTAAATRRPWRVPVINTSGTCCAGTGRAQSDMPDSMPRARAVQARAVRESTSRCHASLITSKGPPRGSDVGRRLLPAAGAHPQAVNRRRHSSECAASRNTAAPMRARIYAVKGSPMRREPSQPHTREPARAEFRERLRR